MFIRSVHITLKRDLADVLEAVQKNLEFSVLERRDPWTQQVPGIWEPFCRIINLMTGPEKWKNLFPVLSAVWKKTFHSYGRN